MTKKKPVKKKIPITPEHPVPGQYVPGKCNGIELGIGSPAQYVDVRTFGSPMRMHVMGEGPIKFNETGSKYLRTIQGAVNNRMDVYAVIETFDVRCPARQHALKKILCTGLRGKGDSLQDLKEARDALDRAIQLEEGRQPGAKIHE